MAYSQEELNSIVDALIIDNTTNQITPAKVRETFKSVISSLDQTNAGSVSAQSPLNYDAFTNVFSILKADATTNGYLSSEDWARFDSAISDATPDATSSVKGKLKLTGDLGGTADLPTVPGLENKADLIGGKVPSSQLPSYVDDILEGYLLSNVFYEDSSHTIVIPAESGKIYIDLTTGQKNKEYRYSGSTYIQITNGLIATSDDVLEGSVNLYFSVAKVLASVLTGLTSSSGTFTSTDSIIFAFGKIKYLIDNISTIYQVILTDANFGAFINGLNSKTTPVDADYDLIMDSADSNKVKKVSFANRKATLKTYFDTLYQTILVSGTNIKTFAGVSILGSGDIPVQIDIITSINITNATTGTVSGSGSFSQHGKNVIIQNGSNNINYTINGAITTSFLKHGSGTITFVQGSGRTLVLVDGTASFSGVVGSTATISSVGTTDYLSISNR